MPKIVVRLWFALILTTGSGTVAATNDEQALYNHTDRLIVRMKPGTVAQKGLSDADHAAARERVGRKLQTLTSESIRSLRTMGDGAHILKLNRRLPLHEVNRIAAVLAKDPDVLDVVPDRLFFPQLTPTDPQYASQWNLTPANGINMPGAWDITTGSNSLVIAVLDTGMLPHNDLVGRWIGGYDFVSLTERSNDGNLRDADATDPGDWVTSAEAAVGQPLAGCTVTDSRWHGTMMAGVIAANANNGQGIPGINWNSKILPMRVVGKCGGYESDIADGMRWAVGLPVSGVPNNPNPARVVNLSLAASGACTTPLQNAINDVIAANAPVVVSAGNQSANANGFSPGNCANVITVGAVDKNGGKPTYTNFGTTLSLNAPGGIDATDNAAINILTTQNQGLTTANPNNDYTRTTFGSSISAAQVTGIVSLMLSVNPSLSPQFVKDILQNTSRVFPTGTTTMMPNPSQADCTTALCGTGIADAQRATQAAQLWGNASAQIAAGEQHTLALRTDGALFSWGWNGYGQLGEGSYIVGRQLPVPVLALPGVISAVAVNVQSFALRADGTVWGWGYNEVGQLGDGSTLDRNAPVMVSGLRGVSHIGAGLFHTLAGKTDGSVWAWGWNYAGQLGDGTTNTTITPAPVPGFTNATALTGGGLHSLALKQDGSVWAWGGNTNGQLGDGTKMQRLTPSQVPSLTSVVAVTAGLNSSGAVRTDGSAWTWGANESGQLGDGSTIDRLQPVPVAGLANVIAMSMGTAHTIALSGDGTVWIWGENRWGQLGDGTQINRLLPVQVAGLSNIARIAAGRYHSIAYRADGSIWVWGTNGEGQLGLGNNISKLNPVQVRTSDGIFQNDLTATSFTPQFNVPFGSMRTSNTVLVSAVPGASSISVSGGEYRIGNGSFVSSAGTVNPGESVTVRSQSAGVCGTSSTITLTIAGTPRAFNLTTDACDADPDPLDFLTQAGAVPGSTHTSNTVTITGINTAAPISITGGTFSIGCTGTFASTPATVSSGQTLCLQLIASAAPDTILTATVSIGARQFRFRTITAVAASTTIAPAISAGANLSMGLRSDGAMFSWGGTPAPVEELSGVNRISAGYYHRLAVRTDGTVWAWGENSSGQLADGTFAQRLTPALVEGLSNVTHVAGGKNHSLVLKADGTVWAWGNNSNGQLGTGNRSSVYQPQQVASLANVIAIGAGDRTSFALRADGTVWSWGYNFLGALGDGTISDRLLPGQIAGLSGTVRIAIGANHGLALKNDGALWAWGNNGTGQIGDGTTNTIGTPQLVPGLPAIAHMDAGFSHSLAVGVDGVVRAWGNNVVGEIGDGTTIGRLSPVTVPGLSNIVAVSAGKQEDNEHSLALGADGSLWAWGGNYWGQLGIGSSGDRSSPSQVVGQGGMGILSLDLASFASQIGVPLASLRTSNTITVNGIAPNSPITVSGGEYQVNAGAFTSSPGTISAGQTITLRQTSSNQCGVTLTMTVTVASVARPFSVTTVACDATPDPIVFIAQPDVLAGSTVTSNSVTLAGLNTPAAISVSGGTYSVGCNATFVATPGTILNGQTVCVRQTAAATADTLTTTLLTIGSASFPFDVISQTAPGFTTTPSISTQGQVSIGLRSDGASVGWGSSSLGLFGGSYSADGFTPQIASTMRFVRLSSLNHALGVRSDGTLWAWGSNGNGQLGDGTTGDAFYPKRVPGLTGVTQVSAGVLHSLAVKSDGSVWSWGNNGGAQLGDGTSISRLSPGPVIGLSGAINVAAGFFHSLALKADGTVWTWGFVAPEDTDYLTVKQVPGLTGIVAISAGNGYSLALSGTGVVWGWGKNTTGQLGIANSAFVATPVQVPNLTNVSAIAANLTSDFFVHSLAVKADGTLWAWGGNSNGQLGDGTTVPRIAPAPVPGILDAVQVAVGRRLSLALRADGTVMVFGDTLFAGLGVGSTGRFFDVNLTLPVPVSGFFGDGSLNLLILPTRPNPFSILSSFGAATGAAITSSPFAVAGLRSGVTSPITVADGPGSSGAMYSINGGAFTSTPGTVVNGNSVSVRVQASASFSSTSSATLTIGGGTGRSSAFYVRTRRSNAVVAITPEVALGNSHSFALNADGTAFAVGYNGNGQLGNGSTLGSSVLQPVAGLPRTIATASGAFHGLALRDDGTVGAWGYNAAGQLGHGIDVNSERYFVNVAGLGNVVAIAAGDYHSLALKQDGTVWAWGLNVDGQIGQGNTTTSRYLVPVQVTGLAGVTAIAAGGRHNLAVLANGSVVAWGSNSSGQLGDGTTINKSAPVPVNTFGSGVLSVSAGGAHSLAIKTDSSAVSWGDNAFGQLGDGSTVNKSAPVAIAALGTGVALLSAGANHSMAVKSGGALYTWGANTNSQLGDGATSNRTLPFAVAGRTNMVSISGGARHSAAINARGELFIWGDNYFGQVGNKSGNYNPAAVSLNVLRGDSEISTVAQSAGSSTGTASSAGSAVIEIAEMATGYDFKTLTLGVSGTALGKFKNQALTDDITGIGISISGPGFILDSTTCAATLAAGTPPSNECGFTLKFSPTLAGDAVGELQIASSLVGSPERRSLFGTGLAPATPGLKVNATAGETYLSFPPQDVGIASTASNIVITNTGTAPLVVTSASITTGSTHFNVPNTCTTTLAAGTSCTLPITFNPALAGAIDGELTLASNAGNQIVTLSGTGVGTAVGGGLILNAVYSRKLHAGNVTPLDIVIDRTKTITQQVTVEPRTISSGHVIVFQFNQAIMQTGTATAVDGSSTPVGTVSSVIAQGNEVRVSLTNIPDGKRATVSLTNVNGSGNAQVSIGFLLGDVTNSHMVSAADIAATKARSGQAINANTARYDINLNGAINGQDVSVVKAKAGSRLP